MDLLTVCLAVDSGITITSHDTGGNGVDNFPEAAPSTGGFGLSSHEVSLVTGLLGFSCKTVKDCYKPWSEVRSKPKYMWPQWMDSAALLC